MSYSSFQIWNPDEVGNYTSVSIFPSFSERLEWIIFNRLYKHLVCEKFLYWAQFCFKIRVSKEEITSLIARGNEFSKKLMILFWEFPRPFKSFWHHRSKYIIKNLKIYGITSINYDCLSNYVTEKIIHSSTPQITNYYWKYTKYTKIYSVFGPFLFFLYVNDLSNYARHFSSIEQVFADYINLFIEHGNINALFNRANEELLKMKNWFFSNALLSNIKKTKLQN